MPQGETSSSATRMAVQLRPQQKLSATSRSLAIVALLMTVLAATGHLAWRGTNRRAGCFSARAAPGAIPRCMTVMQALSDQFQADDAGDDQSHRRQTRGGRRFAEQIDAERRGADRADSGPDRIGGADR